MATVGAVRAALVAALEAAGLRATADPRSINPPCCLVGLAEGARITGCAYEGTIPVTVISAGAGHADAAGWLDETAGTVAYLTKAGAWSAGTYDLPGAPGALLAYTLSTPAAWEANAP